MEPKRKNHNIQNKILLFPGILLATLALLILFVMPISMFPTIGESSQKKTVQEFTAHLNKRIPAIMDEYKIPGVSIALIFNSETRWIESYGYADLSAGTEMTTSTCFRVESISKPVTAWGVMKLVQQGIISLDEPVMHYLGGWEFPESGYPAEKITIAQLLSNTSGLPLGNITSRYSPKGNIPSLKESLSAEAVLRHRPGLRFHYSNTGFNLLELLIEQVTGLTFGEYMETEILIPLGMHRSGFAGDKRMEHPVAVGYTGKGNPVPEYVYPGKASGGLISNVEDISAFIKAGTKSPSFPEHKVLSTHHINKLYDREVKDLGFYSLVFDGYGSGYFTEILSNGQKAVSHGGQGYGWMAHFHSVPETGDGIVILTNSQRSWPLFAHILSDWAQWRESGKIGMGKIITGQRIIWTLVWIIISVSVLQLIRPGAGLISGCRRFAPMSADYRYLRAVQTGSSAILLSVLAWCVSRDYLFISSVFPIASIWLGYSIFILAVILMWSALFPFREQSQKLR